MSSPQPAVDPPLLPVCRALQNPATTAFVHAALEAGYTQVFPHAADEARSLLAFACETLAASQQAALDPQALAQAARSLAQDHFLGQGAAAWFPRAYHRYKTVLKPETDSQQLTALLSGQRVLDYGCGSGYLAARLARAGYHISTTDVLDYRYPENRGLPFRPMAAPGDIPYEDDSFDCALAQAVLHHIDPEHLPVILQRLARVARRVVVKEDTYNLPPHLPGLPERLASQPLLARFHSLPPDEQFEALALIDYFANAIAQGIPQMNMPFRFKSPGEWQKVFEQNGLRLARTQLAGFEAGRVHQSCHIWFVCERA